MEFPASEGLTTAFDSCGLHYRRSLRQRGPWPNVCQYLGQRVRRGSSKGASKFGKQLRCLAISPKAWPFGTFQGGCAVTLSSRFATALLEHALRRRRIIRQLLTGSSRACNQFPAAIRALALQDVRRAIITEGALEGANPSIRRFWREVLVATFTAGS